LDVTITGPNPVARPRFRVPSLYLAFRELDAQSTISIDRSLSVHRQAVIGTVDLFRDYIDNGGPALSPTFVTESVVPGQT